MRRTSIVLFSILVVFGSLAVARFDLLNAAAQGMQGMPMPTAAEKQKLSDLHKRLAAFKADLTKAGKYSCCLKESCDFCALAAAMCPCGMKVQNEAVCGECKMAWQAGQGKVPNVRASNVKALPDDMAKMMMDMRNMNKGVK